MEISRRAATAEDYDLARRWHHAAFRDVVLRQFGTWDEARQDDFFDDAWTPEAKEIIVVDGVESAYCVVEHRDNTIYLVDLVISPEYQCRGIGSAILRKRYPEEPATSGRRQWRADPPPSTACKPGEGALCTAWLQTDWED